MKNILKKLYRKLIAILSEYAPTFTTKILYFIKFHKLLNLRTPRTLNEKVLWLKLNEYNDNLLVAMCADKYKVREYIIQKKNEDILNELYFVWDTPKQIDWDLLPSQFVLKCNHGCNYNIICSGKDQLDEKRVLKQIEKWYAEDFWKKHAELHYKHIKKKIICEKYLENADGTPIADYKVYCFHGKAYYIMVCDNAETDRKFYFYDTEWNFQRINPDSISAKNVPVFEKPGCFKEMLSVAENLSEPFPFVRVDFYVVNSKLVFGELTFTPAAGLDTNRLPETDILFGDLLKLNIEK